MNMKTGLIIGLAVLAGAGLYVFTRSSSDSADSARQDLAVPTQQAVAGEAMAEVKVPALEGAALMGERAFNAKCASCHGKNAAGQQGVAPPLVHKYYRPGHHGDAAFFMAARNGVRSHHWRFGDMPPVKGITEAEIKTIVAYVRALQKENGIY